MQGWFDVHSIGGQGSFRPNVGNFLLNVGHFDQLLVVLTNYIFIKKQVKWKAGHFLVTYWSFIFNLIMKFNSIIYFLSFSTVNFGKKGKKLYKFIIFDQLQNQNWPTDLKLPKKKHWKEGGGGGESPPPPPPPCWSHRWLSACFFF